ncbi:MAG: hypothetical protein JNM00_11455, partial [Flavobacteriales bacterium]|nr:hypothetical protein [Flavobacteriales bacterium]
YFPKKGNWGTTLGLTGLNVVNWDAHTAPTGSLLFRYYFLDCASYRLGFNPYVYRSFNTYDLGSQFQESTVVEKGVGLSLGYQNNFEATTRLNPYAGADFVFSTSRMNTHDYTYTVDEDDEEDPDGPWTESEILGAKAMTFALRPFVGFEYYVAPKLSIGGEVGYDLSYRHFGPTKSTITSFDGEEETTTESEGLPASELNFGGQSTALIMFSYYFTKRCCDKEIATR